MLILGNIKSVSYKPTYNTQSKDNNVINRANYICSNSNFDKLSFRYFSPQIYFHGISEEEKIRFLKLQQEAKRIRKQMPTSLQFLYPLKGNTVGMNTIETIQSQIASNPLLVIIYSDLAKDQEFSFLKQLAVIKNLAHDSNDSTKRRVASEAGNLSNPELLHSCIRRYASSKDPDLIYVLGNVKNPVLRDDIIIKLTKDTDSGVREAATKIVRLMDDPTLKDSIFEKLSCDPDSVVRKTVVEAAEFITDDDLRDSVFDKLSNDNVFYVKTAILKVINNISKPDLKDSIVVKLSNDPDDYVRKDVLSVLDNLSTPELTDSLIEKFTNDNSWQINKDSMGKVKDISNVKLKDSIYKRLSKNDNWSIREIVAKNVSYISDSMLRDYVIENLSKDKVVHVRNEISKSLDKITNLKLRNSAINKLVSDDAYEVRRNVALQIKYIKNPILRDKVIYQLSNDNDSDVRQSVARSLNQITNPILRNSITKKLANDKYYNVRRSLVRNIEQITNINLRDSILLKLSNDNDFSVGEDLAKIVMIISDPDIRDRVIANLANGYGHQVTYLMRTIENISSPTLRYHIIEKLANDDNCRARSVAAELSEYIYDPNRRDSLIEKLSNDDNEDVKKYVIKVIEYIRDHNLRDRIIEKLSNDDNDYVRTDVAEIIEKIRNPELQKRLIIKFAEDTHWLARNHAVRSVEKLDNVDQQEKIVIKLANDSVANVRSAAAEKLNIIRDLEIRNKIINQLANEDSWYVLESIVGQISDPDLRDNVIKKLAYHKEERGRECAAREIANISDQQLRDSLIEKLSTDKMSSVSNYAKNSLKNIRNINSPKQTESKDSGIKVNTELEELTPAIKQINEFLQKYPYMKILERSVEDAGLKDIIYPSNLLHLLYDLNITGQDGGELDSILKYYKKLYNTAVQNPEKFANAGQNLTKDDISGFFLQNGEKMLQSIALVGFESTQLMFTKRQGAFEQYLSNVEKISIQDEDFKVIKKICINNELSAKDRVDVISIFNTYHQLRLDTGIFSQMAESGKIDIRYLKNKLFENIVTSCGMEKNEIRNINANMIDKWDINYLHQIPNAMQKFKNRELLKNIIRSFMRDQYNEFLHNNSTGIGQVNLATKEEYESTGLDYNKWMKYKSSEPFVISSNTKTIQEEFQHIKELFYKDLNTLAQDQEVVRLLQKTSRYKDGKLEIKPEAISSKVLFAKLIKNTVNNLEPYWQGALKSQNQTVLTIKDHFETRINELNSLKEGEHKSFSLEIKLWDRNPGKDLFHGNYCSSCISIEGVNKDAIADYLGHTSVQLIEFKDQRRGNVVGHTTCYMAKDDHKRSFMVLSDIELAPGYQNSNEIRDGIIKFAREYSKSVAKGKDVPVYLGKNFNDVPVWDLNTKTVDLQFIGKAIDNKLYLDSLSGWTDNLNEEKSPSLYVLYEPDTSSEI